MNSKHVLALAGAILLVLGFKFFTGSTAADPLRPPLLAAELPEPLLEIPEQPAGVIPPAGAQANTSSQLVQLIDQFGTPPAPPRFTASNNSNRPAGAGAVLESELSVARSFLHTTTPERILGQFNDPDIFPGAIVDCTPYIRTDLSAKQDNDLRNLKRKPYRVTLNNVGFNGLPSDENARSTYTVPEGLQAQQRSDFNSSILSRINSNASSFRSPLDLTRSSTWAHNASAAQLQLGVSMKTKMIEGSLNMDMNTSHSGEVFVHMITQVYYTLSASPEGDAQDATAWLDDSEANRNLLANMAPRGNNVPGVPALIDSVQYGRIILVAFELAESDFDLEVDASLSYESPTTELNMDALAKYFERAKSGSIKLVVIGGSAESSTGASPDVWTPGIGEVDGKSEATRAIEHVQSVYEAGRVWGGPNIGVPIGVTFLTLGSSPARLKSHAATFSSLVETQPAGSWTFSLKLEIEDDFDFGADDGDWVMHIESGSLGTLWGPTEERKFDSGNTYTETGTIKIPSANWGMELPMDLKLKVDEQDSGANGDNDQSEASLSSNTRRLEKPETYKKVTAILMDQSGKYAALRSALETARADYYPRGGKGRAQFEQSLERVQSAYNEVLSEQKGLPELRETAWTELKTLELNGIAFSGTDSSNSDNKYTLYLKPDLAPYRDAMDTALEQRASLIKLVRVFLASQP